MTGSSVLGTGGTAVFASHLGGSEAKFECPSNDFNVTLESLGAGTGLILFLGCKETAPVGCELSAKQEKEIDVRFTAQLESATLATLTGSKGGSEFTTLEIVGCSLAGNYTVTGSQMVEIPEGGTSKVDHEVIAKKSQSKLKLGVELASFSSTTNNAMLSGGLAWLVMSGE